MVSFSRTFVEVRHILSLMFLVFFFKQDSITFYLILVLFIFRNLVIKHVLFAHWSVINWQISFEFCQDIKNSIGWNSIELVLGLLTKLISPITFRNRIICCNIIILRVIALLYLMTTHWDENVFWKQWRKTKTI